MSRILTRRNAVLGYPDDDDTDSRAATVSVDYPEVVQRYRHGHEMVSADAGADNVRTENLRKAMVDFRTVLESLLEGDREPVGVEGR